METSLNKPSTISITNAPKKQLKKKTSINKSSQDLDKNKTLNNSMKSTINKLGIDIKTLNVNKLKVNTGKTNNLSSISTSFLTPSSLLNKRSQLVKHKSCHSSSDNELSKNSSSSSNSNINHNKNQKNLKSSTSTSTSTSSSSNSKHRVWK
jgi:hypothetical protein